MQKNENGPGYKKTKVGWIPEGWDAVSGADVSKKITKGSSPNWQGFNYQSEGVLFVTSENVKNGYLDINSPKFLPLGFNQKLKNSVLQDGDILINIVGASISRACRFSGAPWPANVNQAVCILRCNNDASSEFLLSYFQTSRAVDKLFSSQVESARPNVSLTDIRDFPISLPPLPEQKAIAGVLGQGHSEAGTKNREEKADQKGADAAAAVGQNTVAGICRGLENTEAGGGLIHWERQRLQTFILRKYSRFWNRWFNDPC